YLSVMNHSYQTTGLICQEPSSTVPCTASSGTTFTEGHLDYARPLSGTLTTPTESSLSETPGLGSGAALYGARHYCSATGSWVPFLANNGAPTSASQKTDWNCNGTKTDSSVNFDVTGDATVSTSAFPYYNDWNNLQF